MSAIRSRDGFNNNPSAKVWNSVQKLLVRHQISTSGNCAILDNTSLLPLDAKLIDANVNAGDNVDVVVDTYLEHDYTCAQRLSLYVEDVCECYDSELVIFLLVNE